MNEKKTTGKQTLPPLGEQVRKWRMAQKMTQAELEEKAGLSHNALSRIECGSVSPRLGTLDQISRALNVSIEQLQFQTPSLRIAEDQSGFGDDDRIKDLILALKETPEPKRSDLLRTFMELVRIAGGK